MTSVLLVAMPFMAVEHPSLALGLLKAGLTRAGIDCRAHYANLHYAHQVGIENYVGIEILQSDLLVGEWIFSRAAFGAQAPPQEAYLSWIERSIGGWEAEHRNLIQTLRSSARVFVEKTARAVLKHNPRIVGATSMFQQHCATLALLRRLKELQPELITIMGGANCEGPMGQSVVRCFPFVDYAVSGEADEIFPRLCGDLLEGKQPEPTYGVLCRQHPVVGAPRATVQKMDVLPLPDFHDYFETLEQVRFGSEVEPGLIVEASRGCWWGQKHHCTFCGLNGGGMGYRIKSSDRVLAEMDQLAELHGVRRFGFADNILDLGHLKTVIPELARRERPYSLFYETKSNLRREQVELLTRAGVCWIQPGIESLDDRILELMDKGSTALMNVQLLRFAREYGMRLSWNFLVAFPREDPAWSEEGANQWLERLAHLQPPSGLSRVRYDRFSPYHSWPERYGVELRPNPSYAMVYPLEDGELAEMAYYFDDRDPSQRSLSHPAYVELDRQIKLWRDLWKEAPPQLIARDDGKELEVLDTRPLARQRLTRLGGAARAALLECETPRSLEVIERQHPGALQELDDRRLVLVLNGKVLSLTLPGEVPPPQVEEFPGGYPCVKKKREYQGRKVTCPA